MVKPSEKRLAHFRDLVAFDRALPGFGTSLAGMDEAGRGPLVGNVVAACVILPAQPLYEWIDDSKRLSPKRREEMYERIMETALFVGVGEASPEEIDRLNILNATRLAMRRRQSVRRPPCAWWTRSRDWICPFRCGLSSGATPAATT